MRLPAFRPARLTALAVLACAAALVPAASASATAASASAAPPCATAGLVIWLRQGGVAAGTAFYVLNFTNLSGRACTLDGHPGVSAASLRGSQVGSPAAWGAPAPASVRIASDGTAYALVRYSDVIVSGSGPSPCDAVVSAGLKVFPPGQTAGKTVPLPLPACTRPVVYMTVGSVQKDQPGG